MSEALPHRRGPMIIGLILLAELALVVFAIVPPNLKLFAIFANGLPLGMVWGLVFSFLEGRRISDILGAGLCASFIVSSGVMKSVGRSLVLDYGVPEIWMPALTGLLFLPLLGLSLYLLVITPAPNAADQQARMVRSPMNRDQRRQFFRSHYTGLTLLIVAYVTLTLVRDFRDNFAVEIWGELGFAKSPGILAISELPVAAVVLALMGASLWIRNNHRAMLWQHLIILSGGGLITSSTLAFQNELIGPVTWMVLLGTGIYMGYVPYNSVLPDRMTAALRLPGNAAFFIYLADTSGYAGSVLLMMWRNFGQPGLSWVAFFTHLCLISGLVVMVTVLASTLYFRAVQPVAPGRTYQES